MCVLVNVAVAESQRAVASVASVASVSTVAAVAAGVAVPEAVRGDNSACDDGSWDDVTAVTAVAETMAPIAEAVSTVAEAVAPVA